MWLTFVSLVIPRSPHSWQWKMIYDGDYHDPFFPPFPSLSKIHENVSAPNKNAISCDFQKESYVINCLSVDGVNGKPKKILSVPVDQLYKQQLGMTPIWRVWPDMNPDLRILYRQTSIVLQNYGAPRSRLPVSKTWRSLYSLSPLLLLPINQMDSFSTLLPERHSAYKSVTLPFLLATTLLLISTVLWWLNFCPPPPQTIILKHHAHITNINNRQIYAFSNPQCMLSLLSISVVIASILTARYRNDWTALMRQKRQPTCKKDGRIDVNLQITCILSRLPNCTKF